MWYGLTRWHVLRGLIFFAILGVLTTVAALIGVQFEKPGPRHYEALAYLLLGLPTLWLILASILTITWLKVEGNCVEWYAWKHFLLLRCPVGEVTRIGGGSFSAMIIRTQRGTIRLFGLYLADRGDSRRIYSS